MAPDKTSDSNPRVIAFQVFNAIMAKANGTSTVDLNFNPNKNGIMTFFTNPLPVIKFEKYFISIQICSNKYDYLQKVHLIMVQRVLLTILL